MAHIGENISELPPSIRAAVTENKLYLIADFDQPTDCGRILVYLINLSGQDLEVETEDGDVYLKLEYQDPTNPRRWIRAQPHGFSWCGNSYVDRIVGNNHFIAIPGYQPSFGTNATIRYHLYNQPNCEQLSSNVGTGLVNQEDITKAKNDLMAVATGDFEFVVAVAKGTTVLHNTMDRNDLRESAIGQLGSARFEWEKAKEVLQELAKIKDRYGTEAKNLLKNMERQP